MQNHMSIDYISLKMNQSSLVRALYNHSVLRSCTLQPNEEFADLLASFGLLIATRNVG